MTIKNNIVGSTYLYRTELNPFQGELKKINKDLNIKLQNTIKKRGFDAPIYIRYEHDNLILDGHQRLIALNNLADQGILLEDDKVPVVYIKADTEKEAKEKVMEYNSKYSEFDESVLLQWIDGLDMDDIELGIDIDLNIEDSNEYDEEKEDEVPQLVQNPEIQLGDIFQLGDHKIICGDATNEETIKTLMDNKTAQMVWTDPPYNIDYSGKGKNLKTKKIENDKIHNTQFKDLLVRSFTNLKDNTDPKGGVYIRHNRKEQDTFKQSIEEIGYKVKQQLIWNKPSLGLGGGDYRPKHELCFYVGNKETDFYGDRTNSTVIDMRRDNVNYYIHPTQKPVELCELAIKNSSKKGDLVIDLFAGSGVTVITCEKHSRVCYAMELDPIYVQAIVKRYHIYTKGKKEIRCLNRDVDLNKIFTT